MTKFSYYFLAVLVVIVVVFAAMIGTRWWMQSQWFNLPSQQLAAIERIGQLPPSDWDRSGWQEAMSSLYNVWGNVTYHPEHFHLSSDQMRSLLQKLERIASETTGQNSVESVERVFEIMLQFGQDDEFISRHRDAFSANSKARNDAKLTPSIKTPQTVLQ